VDFFLYVDFVFVVLILGVNGPLALLQLAKHIKRNSALLDHLERELSTGGYVIISQK